MRLGTMCLLMALVVVAGCATFGSKASKGSFGDDVAFLRAHTKVLVLSDDSGKGQVAVIPAMQGRIMTSTTGGAKGPSFGWINRELVAAGKFEPHINVFGGEDRFWIGPEGGQFSIFFAKGVPFDFDHWFTPAPIDTEPFDLIAQSDSTATFRKTLQLENYSGTDFDVQVDREIRVLQADEARTALGVPVGSSVKMVAVESNNKITNIGNRPWKKETGLLSIWILGMFNPSPATTIVVPFVRGPEDRLGPIVNDAYFGKVPSDRLVVKDGVMFFSADGQYRSKIGLSPQRAKDICGSYDAANKVLTIVRYNKPRRAADYVNSMWELQEHPYRGDVINSYNDGPVSPGADPLGPFYELETSSPAAALAVGESIVHTHCTFHLAGSEAELDPIAQSLLGVTLAEITSALP